VQRFSEHDKRSWINFERSCFSPNKFKTLQKPRQSKQHKLKQLLKQLALLLEQQLNKPWLPQQQQVQGNLLI
jgi:hypothetical protein